MPIEPKNDEKEFLATVETRLTLWRRFWNAFMLIYFMLGVIGVICSTIAASNLVPDPYRGLCSLAAAVCIATIAFLRPETRYRNLVRAWRELKAAKDTYLFQTEERKALLQTLRETERIATDDDAQSTYRKNTDAVGAELKG